MKLVVILEVDADLSNGPDPIYEREQVIRHEVERWFLLLDQDRNQTNNVSIQIREVEVLTP